MSFPVYKKISINSHQRRLIFSQLDQIDFGEQPYIFELSHMITKQEEALTNIENYLKEHCINTYTYPIVIVANIHNYKGKLMVINDIKQVPLFFKQKTRQLNTKEVQKLKYVELKQTHMQNMIMEEFEPILEDYTIAHRKIYKLHEENVFLKQIKKGLGLYE